MKRHGLHPVTAANCGWLRTLRRYFLFVIPAHLVWETAQLPLYTIWYDGTPAWIAFAVLHCSAGDVMIAGGSLLALLLLHGTASWPDENYVGIAVPVVLIGVGITVFGEWYHTEIRNSWAYSRLMPTVPGLGTGLSPLLQWVIIPITAFWWARPRHAERFMHAGELR